MKTVLIACAAFATLILSAPHADAQEVRVTLTGVESRGGEILASLQTEDQFMQQRGAYAAAAPSPTSPGEVTLVFADVAPGAYTLSVIHDADGDYHMQRQPDGRPLEGWTMSHAGAVLALHARPTFDVARFTVAAAPVALTEAMIYPAAH